MRAAVLRAYREPLSLESVADPVCEADGVVLKTLACGICRSDWHGWVGEHPKVKPGDIPGHEYCGEVVEAGPLAKWRTGDRVIAPFILPVATARNAGRARPPPAAPSACRALATGGLCRICLGSPRPQPDPAARKPDARAGRGLGCRVTTAFHALTGRAALQAGEWLAVHGTGGMGLSLPC
jgi:D-arabinose 1-dehydrogenase-like Zn-dependent alcohol dehydrogenase